MKLWSGSFAEDLQGRAEGQRRSRSRSSKIPVSTWRCPCTTARPMLCLTSRPAIEDTALPGTPGNVGIAAHRDGYFRALKDIKEGDELVLKRPWPPSNTGSSGSSIAGPDRPVSVIEATPGRAVTLVGCYPFYHVGPAPQRFIVRAVPVRGRPRPRSTAGQLTLPGEQVLRFRPAISPRITCPPCGRRPRTSARATRAV